MDVQSRAVLKGFLDLSSRHAAKQVGNVQGSRSTGRIHSLATFNKYVTALKQAGDWAREHAGLRHLKTFTPALAQQYLADRAAQGIGQKQLDTDRNALSFITGKDSMARERALTQSERHSRAYTSDQIRLVAARQNCAPTNCSPYSDPTKPELRDTEAGIRTVSSAGTASATS